jgi:phosphoglycolate phosphatase
LTELGYSVDVPKVASLWGLPFPDLIQGLAPGIDIHDFTEYYAHAMGEEPPRLLPGAAEVLQRLQRRSVPTAILSSSLTRLVRQDLRALGIEPLITDVFGSDRTPARKPDPQALDPAKELVIGTGCPVSRILYVGDSLADLGIAAANGVSFIGVTTGFTTAKIFRESGFVGPIVSSLLQLIAPDSDR